MVTATPLDLEGAFNVRAFPRGTSSGHDSRAQAATPWLIRSSALHALTPRGSATLRELDVERVIDLREPGEGEAASHDLDVVSIPIYRSPHGVPRAGRIEAILDDVLATRGDALAAAVGAIADSDGTVVVHCTIGKDRTGIVIALTLLAAGASEDDVIADYIRSGPEVMPYRRALVEQMLADLALTPAEYDEAWRLNLHSPPEAMKHIIAQVNERGGAESYLRSHGVTDGQLASLRSRWA